MKIFSIALLLSMHSYTTAQTNKIASKKIDSTFASYNSKTPGVVVAVLKDGKVIFKKGYGMANLEYDIPITPKTVFNIASVSKQFTAFAIYLLENDGLLSFEDDIRKYIPELPDYGTILKVKHLLAHTSGLRDHVALASIAGGYYLADLSNTEQNLKLLSRQRSLNFIPGSTFGYCNCNSNYTLLAIIINRITGKTISEYTREKIFLPLSMNSTQFSDNYEAVVKNKAESYELQNNRYFHKPLIECRVSKGISAQASHRTVLAPLNAHGSSWSKNNQHYSLILLNSILFCLSKIVFVSSNEQAKPFALFCFHKMSSLLRFSPQLFYASHA